MTNDRASSVRIGADSFQHLLNTINHAGQASLAAHWSAHPDDEGEDRRDYRALAKLVQDSLIRGLTEPDEVRREGFVRALTDALCMYVDGCSPEKNWDSVRATAWAFGEEAGHG